MKIELKSIVFSERLSEETNCFTANLYVDDKKVGTCENRGIGGSTDYYFDDSNKRDEVEAYCKTLPDIQWRTTSFKNSLEMQIDELFEEWLSKKANTKLIKDCDNGLCYGTKDHYTKVNWGKHSIRTLLADSRGREILMKKVTELSNNGENILNTNLPKGWFEVVK